MSSSSSSLTASLPLSGHHQRHPQCICCTLAELSFWIVDRVEDVLKELLHTLGSKYYKKFSKDC